MLKTQMQATESEWTKNDAESSSPQTDLLAPPGPQCRLKTHTKLGGVAEKVQTKETAPKTGKAKPGRKQSGTSPVPPSSRATTRVQTRNQNRSEAIESDSLPEHEGDAIAVPRPSGIAASRTGPVTAANHKATGPRVAPAVAAKSDPQVQSKVSSSTGSESTTQAPTRPQTTSEPRQPTTEERIAHRAKLLKSAVFAAQMATTIQLDASFDQAAFRAYLDQLLSDAGNPTDPVERILIEQIAMAHLRVGDLSVFASGARGNEPIKILNSATARLIGEVRKTALALAAYRERTHQANKQPRSPGKKRTASR